MRTWTTWGEQCPTSEWAHSAGPLDRTFTGQVAKRVKSETRSICLHHIRTPFLLLVLVRHRDSYIRIGDA